jgi:phospho-N-acetylmuramoyl-pentapeptide-transferase
MADGRIYQDMLVSVLISFAVTVAAGKIFIPMLRRLKVSQTERTDGPQSHLKKTGTATMGGVLFLAGILVSTLVFAHSYPGIIPLAVLTFGFGLIGFADDYIKVVLKRSMGLRAWQKLLLQFILTLVFLAALTMTQHECRSVHEDTVYERTVSGSRLGKYRHSVHRCTWDSERD